MTLKMCRKIKLKCEQFATLRMKDSTALYKKRGEQNAKKIYADIYGGTLAEWAVYYYLHDKGIKVNEPDMTIHDTKNKSYAPDLSDGIRNFHVKSQSLVSSNRYGYSWLFQKNDKILQTPGKNDYFVFTSVDGDKVRILAVVKVKDIVRGGFVSTPKIYRYKHSKHAIYFDEVMDSTIELWRF